MILETNNKKLQLCCLHVVDETLSFSSKFFKEGSVIHGPCPQNRYFHIQYWVVYSRSSGIVMQVCYCVKQYKLHVHQRMTSLHLYLSVKSRERDSNLPSRAPDYKSQYCTFGSTLYPSSKHSTSIVRLADYTIILERLCFIHCVSLLLPT